MSNFTEEEITEALRLYDAGTPVEIQNESLKTYLNGHRWGWHQQKQYYCPACCRDMKDFLAL
jgi:hypothetical protein